MRNNTYHFGKMSDDFHDAMKGLASTSGCACSHCWATLPETEGKPFSTARIDCCMICNAITRVAAVRDPEAH